MPGFKINPVGIKKLKMSQLNIGLSESRVPPMKVGTKIVESPLHSCLFLSGKRNSGWWKSSARQRVKIPLCQFSIRGSF
jgi:hypothetical protein